MNYYQRHIGDYAKKAGHLTPLEHGVYCLLLDAYYDREQGPTHAEAIRWSRARSPEELAALESVLFEFFKLKSGRYSQARVEEEFAKWAEYQDKQRDNGKKGGRPRKANANPDESGGFSTETQAIAKPNPKKASSTNPLIHSPLKQKTTPSGVDFGDVNPQVVADFTAHRKALRAPVTETALAGIRREAEKAGVSLEVALALCCARGWRGFKAAWLIDAPTGFAAPATVPHRPGGVSPAITGPEAKARERDALAAMQSQLREYAK